MLRYYRDCDSLPIYNFHKILETKNLNYLYLDYDEYEDIESDKDLSETWSSIYEEYLKLTNDNTTLMYYELTEEVLYLETRYKVAFTLINNLVNIPMTDEFVFAYCQELSKWKFKIDLEKDLGEELDKAIKQLKASEVRLKLKQKELKDLIDKNNDGESLSLVKQVVKLEQGLGRNNIDPKTTSVTKWIALIEQVRELSNEMRKQNGK